VSPTGPSPGLRSGPGARAWTPDYLAAKSQLLKGCRDRAAEKAPGLGITYAVHVDDPAAMLVKASVTASLLVLGSSGLGRTTDLLRGATTHKVVAHARCAVMVTPHTGDRDDGGPIVVGVDVADHSLPALEWAFAEASTQGAPLVAVHTWWWEEPNAYLAGNVWEGQWDEIADSEKLLLAEMFAGWREKYPDVTVEPTLVRGQATVVLEDLSASSRLVVVGTRGRGGFTGLLLGSVSDHLAHHAHCPVVVVPSTSN
jgi:nucleotide-binding universal stress UspA family protein